MKIKFILSSAIVLSSICTAFALAYSIQLKFNDARSDVLIWSKSNDDICSFNVVFLSETNPMTQGRLQLKNGTNRVATCPVEGTLLSDNPKGWGSLEKFEYYKAMTNRFRRSLNGARVFEFEVATNLLEESTFSVGDSSGGSSFSEWFYLKDFAQTHSVVRDRNCELVIDAINRENWDALRKLAKPEMRANEYIKLWENSAKAGRPVRVGKLINVNRDSRYLDDKSGTMYSFALENRDGTLNPHWLQISVREERKKPVLLDFWNFGW